MSRCVVLVVTRMGGDRWCSIVLDKKGGKYRVNFPYPHYLRAALIRQGGGNPDLWHPGRIVDLQKSRNKARRRLTHPEDTNFQTRPIITTDQTLDLEDLVRRLNLLVNNATDLFGVPIQFERNCAVVPENTRVTTSCGLIQLQGVRIYEDNFDKLRANFTIGGTDYQRIPVAGFDVEELYEEGATVLNGIAIFGLANPYRPSSWDDGPKFCFVQMTGFIVQS